MKSILKTMITLILGIGVYGFGHGDDDLLETAKEMIATIAAKAPLAVSLALEALRASDLPLHEGLRHEAALFGQTCASDDFKEGVAAFLERRKADFKGQ